MPSAKNNGLYKKVRAVVPEDPIEAIIKITTIYYIIHTTTNYMTDETKHPTNSERQTANTEQAIAATVLTEPEDRTLDAQEVGVLSNEPPIIDRVAIAESHQHNKTTRRSQLLSQPRQPVVDESAEFRGHSLRVGPRDNPLLEAERGRREGLLRGLGVSEKRIEKLKKDRPQLFNPDYTIENIKEDGIQHPEKMIKEWPVILSYTRENIQDRLNFLNGLGISKPTKVMEQWPQVMGLSPECIQEKISNLRTLGFVCPERMIGLEPAILGLDEKNVQNKIVLLRGFGLPEPVRVLEAIPRLIGMNPLTLEKKYLRLTHLALMYELAISPADICTTIPEVLSDSPEKMQLIARILRAYAPKIEPHETKQVLGGLRRASRDNLIIALSNRASNESIYALMTRIHQMEKSTLSPEDKKKLATQSINDDKIRRLHELLILKEAKGRRRNLGPENAKRVWNNDTSQTLKRQSKLMSLFRK